MHFFLFCWLCSSLSLCIFLTLPPPPSHHIPVPYWNDVFFLLFHFPLFCLFSIHFLCVTLPLSLSSSSLFTFLPSFPLSIIIQFLCLCMLGMALLSLRFSSSSFVRDTWGWKQSNPTEVMTMAQRNWRSKNKTKQGILCH